VQGTGHAVGLGSDYSTFAVLFAPDYRGGHFLPMIDVRGHRFDNNTYAANLGFAVRYIPRSQSYYERDASCCKSQFEPFCELLGFNIFYDYRHTHRGHYNQIGLGLEVLGKRWDLRANGYIPFGNLIRHKTNILKYKGGFYEVREKCEFTSYGYNLEVGYLAVKSRDFLVYAAGGPYYLARKNFQKTFGGEVRLRPQYKNYLALDLILSHDPVFQTVFQASIILYLPLYQIASQKAGPCCITDRQIYQPIERFEVMPLGKRCCWKSNW
jgi:hypothetical protein